MKLVNATLFEKYVEYGLIIEIEHLWVCTKFMSLRIPISLDLVLKSQFLTLGFLKSTISQIEKQNLIGITDIHLHDLDPF